MKRNNEYKARKKAEEEGRKQAKFREKEQSHHSRSRKEKRASRRDASPPPTSDSRDSSSEPEERRPLKSPLVMRRRLESSPEGSTCSEKSERSEKAYAGTLATRAQMIQAGAIGSFIRSLVELGGHQFDCLFDTEANLSLITHRAAEISSLSSTEERNSIVAQLTIKRWPRLEL